MLRRSSLVVALAALVAALPVQAAQLLGVRMHEAPNYTRVVFDTSGPLPFELFSLEDPKRVVIDLPTASLAQGFDPRSAAYGRDRVRQLRVAGRGNGQRVVLDVNGTLEPKGFALTPVAPYGHRLVIDLYSAESDPATTTVAPLPAKKRNVIVAIDAGHGGEDSGAPAAGATTTAVAKKHEKDVVLSIAKRVATLVNAQKGFKAVLVREGDYYISLRERIQIARAQRADLFVSIHADAFRSPDVSGASVYTLSESGATSETARWLAAKENQSDLIGGVGDVSLGDKDEVLAQVLLDLSTQWNRSASLDAGRAMVGRLGRVTKMHKAKVEQAGFVVLKSPDIPSVLVETGYMSNPQEAQRLASAAHQEKIAKALVGGITDYLRATPPRGSLLAERADRDDQEHTIRRGDTLSGIAARYGTSSTRIKQVNDLAGDAIRVGQILIIPTGS